MSRPRADARFLLPCSQLESTETADSLPAEFDSRLRRPPRDPANIDPEGAEPAQLSVRRRGEDMRKTKGEFAVEDDRHVGGARSTREV